MRFAQQPFRQVFAFYEASLAAASCIVTCVSVVNELGNSR